MAGLLGFSRLDHLALDGVCLLLGLLAPQIAVEFGRKVLFHDARPTYVEVDERVRQK